VGVFSENVLVSYLVSKGELLLDNNICINELEDYISLEKHKSESFEFLSRTATYFDLKELFSKYIIDKKRLAVVYITHSGNKNEKLLGMVTAWDMPKGEKIYGKV
jgi:hypothetical protein